MLHEFPNRALSEMADNALLLCAVLNTVMNTLAP
jgi:hypothetical protein